MTKDQASRDAGKHQVAEVADGWWTAGGAASSVEERRFGLRSPEKGGQQRAAVDKTAITADLRLEQ